MTYKVTILPSITRTSKNVDMLCHVKIFALSCVEVMATAKRIEIVQNRTKKAKSSRQGSK